MQFYTYLHCKPDGTPFYVGKGRGKRAFQFGRRNRHYRNTVEKYGKENILVGKLDCSTESIALNLECGIIKCLRRMGFALTNLTNGGEGTAGLTPYNKGLLMPVEQRRKVSAGRKGKGLGNTNTLGKKLTEEHKRKCSEALKGRSVSSGWHHTAEAKKKISEAHLGKPLSAEHVEKIATAHRGRKHTEKTKLNMSMAAKRYVHVGTPHTEETKARMSAARKGVPWSEARREAQRKRGT